MIRSTGTLVLASLAMVAGLMLVVTGWRQPRPSLTQAIGHLRRPSAHATVERQGAVMRIGAAVERAEPEELRRRTTLWTQRLRIIGRPLEAHLGMLVLASLAGLVAPTLLLGTLQAAGLVTPAAWVPAIASLAFAAAAPLVVHNDAMARSAEVAADLRHQVGAYLDVVTMLLAGNTGYEGALEQAARAGDGMLFRALRRRMREVTTTGHSLVGALEMVADDYGLIELEQVAATARLSAAEGAPVARSLSAKCATLRSTLAAEQEAEARVRVDKVTPPLVGMALLFMALILYPALDL